MTSRRSIYIDRRRMPDQQTESPGQALGKLSEVYRFWVPRGQVFEVDRTRPFIFYLTTVETITFPPHTNNVSTASVSRQITRVVDAGDGHTDSRFVMVWDNSDGAQLEVVGVGDHIDGDNPGTVSVVSTDMATFSCQVAYVPYAEGQLVLSVDAPVGLGQKSHPIFDGDAKTVFSSNQWKHQAISAPILLPPDFSIVAKINSNWPVAFENGVGFAPREILFNLIRIPVRVLAEQDFFVPGEPAPGHSLRMLAERRLMEAVR